MAKWYYLDEEDRVSAYNMEWFREVTMDLIHFTGEKKESWCLRFEYAVVRQGEEDRGESATSVKTAYADFEVMERLYNKVIEWLQSPAAVFHHKQALEECFKEAEGEVQC